MTTIKGLAPSLTSLIIDHSLSTQSVFDKIITWDDSEKLPYVSWQKLRTFFTRILADSESLVPREQVLFADQITPTLII